MRSFFSFGESKEIAEAITGGGSRPEDLRRQTLADNAIFIIVASALIMPIVIYTALQGATLPFFVAVLALISGATTLMLQRHARYEEAACAQVYLLLTAGMLLTLADSRFVDGGLAIALLGPIYASLMARPQIRRISWTLMVAIGLIASVTATFGKAPLIVEHVDLGLVGLIGFALGAVMIARTAGRIGMSFEIQEKSQLATYRHLIEHVQDAVFRYSSSGELLFLSRSSEKLFGCPRYELTGTGLGQRIHVADRPTYLTAFADANQAGIQRTIEVRMRQDDPHANTAVPQFIWVEINFSPVDETRTSGSRFEVVGLLRDVTRRRDQAAEMEAARHVAEEASIAKSRFLATIGHELRTPLNAVVGFSEMMTSGIGGEMSDTHREYAGLIHQSGTHLLEVVRMLLDMSRIEAGKFEISTDNMAPDDLVEPCLKMVQAVANERDIRISSRIARLLPTVVADERACRQILINLLSNAVKFSHDAGEVTVSLKQQGQYLNLSVSDNGIGMSAEAIAHIGEPFYQANDGLARAYEGTGLGLSIVKGLVELHGGTLRAMSEFGAGTTMTVLLPINGPAIKLRETATVTSLYPDTAPIETIPWQDEKRNAI
ncbi:PAS domain-containing sensor histidine kinase [Devosia rhodophyticola]|uniref:histidine kinase n=1 Tax=Devosia rhodophyticola TaxID=3026423 RepID=A0ABY7Z071_9HYPH|nr:PAS domain-containing sensor histidine kinase [Devosia rhodophyticola]WDR06420.1 PAS domain-containing sensor histidine kinase [Devosia rhodophyticola]